MNYLESIILGVIQGITEFLPISSSGHLVLGQEILGLNVETLRTFDVFVHLGTLMAILLYFYKDIILLLKGFLQIIKGKFKGPNQKTVFLVIIATIPAVIFGLTIDDVLDQWFRNPTSVATFMFLIAIFFWVAEDFSRKFKEKRSLEKLNKKDALLMGLAQAFAIIPGVSRSGSTIATGLFLGQKREEAARFSFLMGVPAIAGAGILTSLKSSGEEIGIELSIILIGFFAAFISGLISIYILMKILKSNSLKGFSVYLMILAIIAWFI
jgi:undecaprenyl-diphosphatase